MAGIVTDTRTDSRHHTICNAAWYAPEKDRDRWNLYYGVLTREGVLWLQSPSTLASETCQATATRWQESALAKHCIYYRRISYPGIFCKLINSLILNYLLFTWLKIKSKVLPKLKKSKICNLFFCRNLLSEIRGYIIGLKWKNKEYCSKRIILCNASFVTAHKKAPSFTFSCYPLPSTKPRRRLRQEGCS